MGDKTGSKGRVTGRKNKGDEIESSRRRMRTGQLPVRVGYLEERRVRTEKSISRRKSRRGKKSRVLDRMEDMKISKRPSHKKHDNCLNWHVSWPQHNHCLSYLTPLFFVIIYPSAHPVIMIPHHLIYEIHL